MLKKQAEECEKEQRKLNKTRVANNKFFELEIQFKSRHCPVDATQ